MKPTLYEALGLSRTATEAEVKGALRRLVRRYYTKTRAGDADVEEALRFLNHASHILGNPARRAEYDANLADNARVASAATTISGTFQADFVLPGESQFGESLSQLEQLDLPRDRQPLPPEIVPELWSQLADIRRTRAGQLTALTSMAVLLVAGFSYRWAYYYNFGLKDLAIQAPVQALAISALELIRTPAEAWSTLLIVALPMFVLSFTIAALQRLGASSSQHSRLRALATWSVSSPLMLDSARAVVLLYTAYWAGSEAGLRKFLTHVVESPENSLPKVTVAGGGKTQDVSFPIACTPADWTGAAPGRSAVPPVVGSPAAVDAFRQGLACNAQGTRSWRLLYRDDRFIYLFATGAAEARPATVILPNNDSIVVILQGGGTP